MKYATKRFSSFLFAAVLMLFIFVNCMHIVSTHDDEMDYNSLMFYLLHTGSRNTDICVIFSISDEGVLTYTMTNSTAYIFESGAVDLFRKTTESFYRVHLGSFFLRGLLLSISPYFILTYDVDIGTVFFKESQITPGIYKFVKEFIFVLKDWENQWLPLNDTYIYAIFEVRLR